MPERAALIFRYDAAAAVTSPDNAEVLAAPKTAEVLTAFAQHIESDAGTDDGRALQGHHE